MEKSVWKHQGFSASAPPSAPEEGVRNGCFWGRRVAGCCRARASGERELSPRPQPACKVTAQSPQTRDTTLEQPLRQAQRVSRVYSNYTASGGVITYHSSQLNIGSNGETPCAGRCAGRAPSGRGGAGCPRVQPRAGRGDSGGTETRGCAFWDPSHMREKEQACVYEQFTSHGAPQPQPHLSAGPVRVTPGGRCSLISPPGAAFDLPTSTISKAK